MPYNKTVPVAGITVANINDIQSKHGNTLFHIKSAARENEKISLEKISLLRNKKITQH